MASFDEPKGEKSPSGEAYRAAPGSSLTVPGRSSSKLPPPVDPEDEEEEGMLRMSFMGHLEEVRKRIFLMLIGIAVAFTLTLTFSDPLWKFVQAPATEALKELHVNPPQLAQIEPMEAFNIVWFKLPTLVAVFLSSPWICYQIWAFIAPGLYKRERRFAAPFVLVTGGLFILGGLFAYFVAFRFGIKFLLGVGPSVGVSSVISMSYYFDLFVNVMLGISIVFELPIIIFFLTLLRIVQPGFLIRHSRYVILGIVVLAAVITPTPDIFNLLLFAVPMCLLFFIGILASYILVLKREKRKLPWTTIYLIVSVVLLLLAGALVIAIKVLHYHFVPHLIFLTR